MVIITMYMRDTESPLHSSAGRYGQMDVHEITENLPYLEFEILLMQLDNLL